MGTLLPNSVHGINFQLDGEIITLCSTVNRGRAEIEVMFKNTTTTTTIIFTITSEEGKVRRNEDKSEEERVGRNKKKGEEGMRRRARKEGW